MNIDAVGAAIDQSREYSDLLGCSCSVFAARRSGLLARTVARCLTAAWPRRLPTAEPPRTPPPPASVAAAALPRPRTAGARCGSRLSQAERSAASPPPPPPPRTDRGFGSQERGGVGRGDWEKRRRFTPFSSDRLPRLSREGAIGLYGLVPLRSLGPDFALKQVPAQKRRNKQQFSSASFPPFSHSYNFLLEFLQSKQGLSKQGLSMRSKSKS